MVHYFVPQVITGRRQSGKTAKLLELMRSYQSGETRFYVYTPYLRATQAVQQRIEAELPDLIERVSFHTTSAQEWPVELLDIRYETLGREKPNDHGQPEAAHFFFDYAADDSLARQLLTENHYFQEPVYLEVDFRHCVVHTTAPIMRMVQAVDSEVICGQSQRRRRDIVDD